MLRPFLLPAMLSAGTSCVELPVGLHEVSHLLRLRNTHPCPGRKGCERAANQNAMLAHGAAELICFDTGFDEAEVCVGLHVADAEFVAHPLDQRQALPV